MSISAGMCMGGGAASVAAATSCVILCASVAAQAPAVATSCIILCASAAGPAPAAAPLAASTPLGGTAASVAVATSCIALCASMAAQAPAVATAPCIILCASAAGQPPAAPLAASTPLGGGPQQPAIWTAWSQVSAAAAPFPCNATVCLPTANAASAVASAAPLAASTPLGAGASPPFPCNATVCLPTAAAMQASGSAVTFICNAAQPVSVCIASVACFAPGAAPLGAEAGGAAATRITFAAPPEPETPAEGGGET